MVAQLCLLVGVLLAAPPPPLLNDLPRPGMSRAALEQLIQSHPEWRTDNTSYRIELSDANGGAQFVRMERKSTSYVLIDSMYFMGVTWRTNIRFEADTIDYVQFQALIDENHPFGYYAIAHRSILKQFERLYGKGQQVSRTADVDRYSWTLDGTQLELSYNFRSEQLQMQEVRSR